MDWLDDFDYVFAKKLNDIRRSPLHINFQKTANALFAHMAIVMACPQTKRN